MLRVGSSPTNGLNVGAVVAEPLDQDTSGPIQSVTRFAMPVLVTVEGGRPAATTGATASAGPTQGREQPIRVTELRPRPGGDRLCPRAVVANETAQSADITVVVRSSGAFGGGSQAAPVVLPALPPLSATTVQLPCVRRPYGPGRLSITAAPPGGVEQVVASSLFWLPLPLGLSLLLLLLLISALLTHLVRGARRDRDGPTAAAE